MKNITLAVDEGVLAGVRLYAADRRTSVNALVREYLERLASETDRVAEARRNLKRLADAATMRRGDSPWNREELHARPVLHRHERADLRGNGEG